MLKRITQGVFVVFTLLTVYGVLTLALHIPNPLPLTPINTVLAFTFAVLHAGQREGWRRTALLAGVVFVTGLAFESVGVATGIIYGPYHYTDLLGPKFLGLVPFLIPIAWTMMMYPALVIAQGLVRRGRGRVGGLAVAALGGMVMTAWDVAMDPMMVAAGNWVWEVPGPYFGVPLQNYWGWWLTTFVALTVYLGVSAWMKRRPAEVGISDRWAVGAYVVMGSSTLCIDLLTHLQGPALAGIFAMLPWMVIGMMKHE